MGYAGRIVSLEPVSASYRELAARAASDPDWEVVQLALRRQAGTQSINVTAVSVFASFLKPNEYSQDRFADGVSVLEKEEVEIRTLDSMIGSWTGAFQIRRST